MLKENNNLQLATKDLLGCFVRGSYKFIESEIGFRSSAAKKSLEKAVNVHQVEIKSFDDTKLDFLVFDWYGVDKDRNWWWQMQALPFLDWLSRCHQLLDEQELEQYFDFCVAALSQWLQQESNSDQSPLRWHDHATAYRLTHLTNWLIVISENTVLVEKLLRVESTLNLPEVFFKHISWLSQEKNYSKHNNHGFDQAMAVFSLGLHTEKKYWRTDVDLAERRLVDELRFAFTEEGVHKENSPGYHVFMMRRLERLVRLKQVGATMLGNEARKIQEGAKRFLEAVTLPDGTLPMVGDTRGRQKGKITKIDVGPIIYDFSKSGYVIIKGLYKDKAYYLLFKNCHDSNYHRHDDDLSIYLFYDGRTLLGDGGLGIHKEDDARRQLLRSCFAHNTPFLSGRSPVRSLEKIKFIPNVRIDAGKIIGVSWSYGSKIKRVVDFSRIGCGFIDIVDKHIDSDISEFCQNFYSFLPTERKGKDFYVGDRNDPVFCLVRNSSNIDQYGVTGNAVVSFDYGCFSKASWFGFKSNTGHVRSRVIFGTKEK